MSTMIDGSTSWEGTIAVSKQSGTKVTLDTDKKYIAKDIELTINVQGGAYSADSSSSSNSTVTPSVVLDNSATSTYGFTTTKPSSGTSGTNYLTIDPNASATAWSVTPRASVTTAGFISAGSKTGSAVSNTPSISAGTNYYQPVVSASFNGGGLSNTNYSKTDLAVTLASGSDTNMTNISVGAKNTSTYPYYFKVSASTPAVSGTTKVSRAAVTYTNNAGAIAANNAATAVPAGESSPTVSVNAASNTTYVNIKSAAISPTVSNSGISTYFNSGTSSDKDVTITPQYTNTAGFVPEHSSEQAGTAAYYKIKRGSATTPSTSITANPTITISDTGLVTASYSGSKSITPTVSAGWISSGTSGTVSTSGSSTYQIPVATIAETKAYLGIL